MVSPEIPVGDGDPEGYLWPSEAIRQKAIDLLMERIQAVAVEKIAAAADAAIKEVNKQTDAKISILTNVRIEAAAAITRLEATIQKAEQTVVGARPQPPEPVPQVPEIINDADFIMLRESVREIAKVCWSLQNIISTVQNDLISKNVYDDSLKAKILGPLVMTEVVKKLTSLQCSLSSAASKCGVYGEY